MNEKILKYLFWLSASALLVIMIFSSRNSGISCDEILHYGQSVKVYNYLTSAGKDLSALEDSDLNLKYYGQSFDNIVTFVTKWFGIDDVYLFRNLMSSLMGWLTIIVTALFAKWLKNYSAALIVVLLFAISPFFIGHSFNNLKDIPFAFAYVAGIWFITRFVEKSGRIGVVNAVLLTFSMAFCISLRAGGLILICYLFLFMLVYYGVKYLEKRSVNSREIIRKTAWVSVMSIVSLMVGSLLWPYALQDPIRNILESYRVMAHYPATFRQLFEGKLEWSDFMPWYYLIKSMAITIPVAVSACFLLFFISVRKIIAGRHRLSYAFILFSVLFPVVFVIIQKSNIYSSWRQFIFIYPPIVVLSAAGLAFFFEMLNSRTIRIVLAVIFLLLSFHPVRFMIKNHPYEYLYYNELAGGVRGAFADYELDYYYTSESEAARWLKGYLDINGIKRPLKVASTYSVSWQFRDHPRVETSWLRYEERSMHDWDYAIIVNRYIHPYQLIKKSWPPKNAIHTINVDGVPICAILERQTKDDLYGSIAMKNGEYDKAIDHFSTALNVNYDDEMIFYNFAGAVYRKGDFIKADSLLKKGLELNPCSEPILMYLGNILKIKGENEGAIEYYRKVISINRKYFDAYISLAAILKGRDVLEARKILRQCISINPGQKDAIIALGDTYSDSNPEIAKRYYEQAKNIN